jgi:uncharacterized protein (TIGR04141 family)
VIVVKVFFRADRLFALTFGAGRFQLRRRVADRSYGLRVALNAIYEGDENALSLDPAARVRQVETRTIGANTIRTRRQTNRSADFEVFELDPDGDQLNGITGLPIHQSTKLGRRVTGADMVRLGRVSTFGELGEICRELARYHERKDYKRRFEFVDNFQPVSESGSLGRLNEALAKAVQDENSDLQFAPPGLIDFDQVDIFRIPDLEIESPDLDITQIRSALAGANIFTIDDLQDLHVEAISGDSGVVDRWALPDCLDGQLLVDGVTYIVEGGDYYRIATGYLTALNQYMSTIDISVVEMPPSVRVKEGSRLKETTEGEYNAEAAKVGRRLLMDKETVIIPGKTSAIEVCDVLTDDRQLVHVKRKFSSSSLSHLFGQGYVSSELLVGSVEYRAAVRERIRSIEKADRQATGNSALSHEHFEEFFPDSAVSPVNFEIVYAIVEDWRQRTLLDLPFFSKVNLRKQCRGLRRLGFRVTYSPVKIVDPP